MGSGFSDRCKRKLLRVHHTNGKKSRSEPNWQQKYGSSKRPRNSEFRNGLVERLLYKSVENMMVDSATNVWLMVSAELVMLMTPGVGLFDAGLVRRKNIISMIALSFVVLAVVSIHWRGIGYSLAFGPRILQG